MIPEYTIPPIRKMFIPDPGHTFFSVDLDRADLQVVAWEAGDEELKDMLRAGENIWEIEAREMWKVVGPISEGQKYAIKQGAHATDYGGSDRAVAEAIQRHLDCSHAEASAFRRRWFARHPGILAWHRRIEAQLQETGRVYNAFNYYIDWMDRIDSILPDALAWIPQSTVAIIIDKGLQNIHDKLYPHLITPLNQIHDELIGQYPTHLEDQALRALHKELLITVPYDDPLVISVGIKTSTVSWGDVEEREWPNGSSVAELAAGVS